MLEGLPELPPSTRELRDIPGEDTKLHWLRLKNEDTPLNRRAYIRAAFAFMEGFVTFLKQHTLAELKAGRTSLTPGELALLLEVSHTASEQGQPLARLCYIPLP